MEPLDSDLEYMVRTPRASTIFSRFDALLLLPLLGLVLLLVFVAAVVFQLNLSDLIGSLMGIMMILFFVMIALFFWALAPKSSNK